MPPPGHSSGRAAGVCAKRGHDLPIMPSFLVWGYSSIVVTTAVMPMRTSSLGVKST